MLADHKECGVCEAKYAGLQETLPPVFDNRHHTLPVHPLKHASSNEPFIAANLYFLTVLHAIPFTCNSAFPLHVIGYINEYSMLAT